MYFVIAFPENYGQGLITLSIASATSQTATVQVSAPLLGNVWSGQQLTVLPGSSQTVTLPAQLQLAGGSIEQKAIVVLATSNIVVFAMNRYQSYCGAFQAIPQAFLGSSYYTVSLYSDANTPKSFDNIAVVASQSGQTSVTFTFPQNKGVQIYYGNSVYDTSLTVTLNQYETIQIQDINSADLSGTLVTSNQPVAVFSGQVVGNVIESIANPYFFQVFRFCLYLQLLGQC